MKPYLSLFLASLVVPLAGCASENTVTAIAFDKTAYVLDVGEQVTVNIRYTGSGKTAKFLSSNELVATIDEQGVITGIGRGEATVFAVCNDIIARAVVMVSTDPVVDKIYQSKGTVSLGANFPAFSLEGTLTSPFTFITGNNPLQTCYLEHELPEKQIMQTFLDFMDSPFIQENPNFKVPEAYGIYKTAIEELLAKEGSYSVRHLINENHLTSYFYAEKAYVSKADIDITESLKTAKLIGLVMESNLGSMTLTDLVTFIKKHVDEGEQVHEYKDLKLLYGALENATLSTVSQENALTLKVTIGEGFGACLSDYLGNPSWGELAKLKSIDLESGLINRKDHYEINSFKVRLAADMFGMENTINASLSVPEDRELLPEDALTKIVDELKALG